MIIRAVIYRSAFLAVIWWILAGGHHDSWTIGIPSVLLAVLLSLRLLPPTGTRISFTGLIGFSVFFVMNSIRSGLQVVVLTLKPRLDVQPKVLSFPLALRNENAQVLLASTLGLLPGTVCMDLKDDILFLHVIDSRMPIEEEVRSAEYRVARLFGEALA